MACHFGAQRMNVLGVTLVHGRLHLKPQIYDDGQPNMFLAQWR
jgi:hypothetical protein